MKTSHNSKDLEKEIIENAKQLFIEKGFAETSMSDIAARTGINRPVLHYYFRTKDKMFQAVFGSIVLSFVPQVQDIILQKDLPFRERAGKIIDAYYQTFIDNPCLPMFMIREIYRDPGHLLAVIHELQLEQYLHKISESLREEMAAGLLKTVPLVFVFYTFYGLVAMPFLSRDLLPAAIPDTCFEATFALWRPHIIDQLENLLYPQA